MMLTQANCPEITRRLATGLAALVAVLVGASEPRASDLSRYGIDGATYTVQRQSEILRRIASEKADPRRDWIDRLGDWIAEFRTAAIDGDGAATYELGRLLLAGPPEVKNHGEGLRWLKSVSKQHFRHEAAPIVYSVLSKFFIDCEELFREPRLTSELESFTEDINPAPIYGPDTSVATRILTLQALLVGNHPGNLEIDPAYAPAWVACARAHGVPWTDIEAMSYVEKDTKLGSAIVHAAKAMNP